MTREALKKLNEKQMNYCKTLSVLIDRAKIKGLKEENERNRGSVTLCWDNLEALCQDCHNKEHHKQERHKRYRFDENGGILPPYQKNN